MTAKPCTLQFFSYWGNLVEQIGFSSIKKAKEYLKTREPMAYYWQIYENEQMSTVCCGTFC